MIEIRHFYSRNTYLILMRYVVSLYILSRLLCQLGLIEFVLCCRHWFQECISDHCRALYIQQRISDKVAPHCGLGYIVPEWVEQNPALEDIKQIYRAGDDTLPTTTIILPLKSDKVKPVKQQLSSIHTEVIPFQNKAPFNQGRQRGP